MWVRHPRTWRYFPYVSYEGWRDQQPSKTKTIRDLLNQGSSRAKGRRRDIRAAEVVHDDPHSHINRSHHALAEEQGTGVVSRIPHFCSDREEGTSSSVGKDNWRYGRDGLCKGRVVDYFEVRHEYAVGGRCGRAVLEANSDSHGEDCVDVRLLRVWSERVATYPQP